MRKLAINEKIQISLLVGGLCAFAFVLQNFEGWQQKEIAKSEPELVSGEIVAMNLIPSNTSTAYMATVLIEGRYQTQLVASLTRARDCSIGTKTEIARRGLNHSWTRNSCKAD